MPYLQQVVEYERPASLETYRLEHKASKEELDKFLNTYKEFEKQGYEVDYIGVNSQGELNIEEFKSKLRKDTALVSIMYANNETGVIYPVEEIGDYIKSHSPETRSY